MGLITFLIIGFLAGLIARAVLPGRQSMGLLATTALGMVGSLIGGLIGSLLSPGRSVMELRPTGLLMSILGALVVLLLVGAAGRGRARV